MFSLESKQAASIPCFNLSKLPMIPSGLTLARVGNNFKVLFLITFEFPCKSFKIISINFSDTFGIKSFIMLLCVLTNSNCPWLSLTSTKLSKYWFKHFIISNFVFSSCSLKQSIKVLIIFSFCSDFKSNPLPKIVSRILAAALLTFQEESSKLASKSKSSYSSYPSIPTFSTSLVLPGSYFNNSIAFSIIFINRSLIWTKDVPTYISMQFKVASTRAFFSS